MRVTVVGCSGSYPGPDSAASCYLVEAPYDGRTFRLVLDLGNGAFGSLQRHIDPREVDAVALSHLHADHCVDLTAYFVHHRFHPEGASHRIPIYGPANTRGRVARAYDLPRHAVMEEQFEFVDWQPDKVRRLGPFDVTVAQVAHPVETYAVRIAYDGRTFVYSGDTGPSDALVDIARDADLMMCEASFVEGEDNPPDLHLTGRQAAEHATRAGADRLLLTHVPPWHDPLRALAEADPVYAGTLELARPGAVHDI